MEKIEDLKQDELENKKHYFYAEINENNICHSLLSTPKITEAENMIEVDSYDMSLLGKRYIDGNWYVSDENETENSKNETEFSETERIQAEMLLNQERIITKQNEHDEILAELLLGQQKGV